MSLRSAIRLVTSVARTFSLRLGRSGRALGPLAAVTGASTVIAGTVMLLGLGGPGRTAAALAAAVETDTVFGPMSFETATGAPQIHVEQFSITVIPGRQYTLSVTNGAADGTLRISSATITLNGESLFDQSEFNETIGFLSRHVELNADNTLEVRVEGAPLGYLTILIEREPDASFVVYGPERFIREQGTPNPTTRTFTIAPDEPPPYVLHVANGDVDSTDRLSAATVTLNGTDVITPTDLNQQVGSVVKEVTLLENNTMVVELQSAIGSFFTIWFTATDTTPPVLTITTPAPGAITNQPQIEVAGTVTDQTNTIVTVNGTQVAVTNGAFSTTVPLPAEGDNLITVSAVDAGRNQTDSTRTVIRDTQPPVLTVTAPNDGLITNQTSITVSGSVFDITPVTVNANGVPLPVDGAGQFTGTVGINEGANLITVTATDAVNQTATVVRVVTRDTQAPAIAIAQPSDGATTTADTVRVSGTVTDATTVTLTVNGQAFTVAPDGSFSDVVPVALGSNTLTTVATDAATNSSTDVRTVTRLPAGPPDPATVATPIIASEASLLQENTAFLYTGENPVQTGVAPGTIDFLRAAVLRGRVVDRAFSPLSGVSVTVHDHPELGSTLTRSDGMFDMAVNGGGTLVVSFARSGYLTVQRHVEVPWQTFTLPDDVVLIRPDSVVTIVDLTSGSIQVAQGSVQQDADGPRQATVFFEPGTEAVLVRPDSTVDTLTTLAVRATEFTVGDSGALMMPAELPPASHYTYAVQVTADEQLAAGPGAEIVFSQPVPLYVENFLGFPVGTPVPVGAYDASAGAWDPERNGVVLKILGTDGSGRALLDVNGDGVADADSALFYYGIDPLETVQLAGTFAAGAELWRAEILRTTYMDLNWGARIFGGTPPAGDVEGPCGVPGADVLRCQLQVQTAFQAVGITGSPFTLNYASDRAKGNAADRTLEIQLMGDTIPPYLLRVQLQIDIAGRRFRAVFLPETSLTYTFTWDGIDAYGRTLQASQPAVVKIAYVYPIAYAAPAPGTESFGLPCAKLTVDGCALPAVVNSASRGETAVYQTMLTTVGGFDAQGMALGGFTFDVQQAYDPVGKMLYAGDGTRRPAGSLPEQIARFAGTGVFGAAGAPILNGVPATQSIVSSPSGLAVAPDGSVYISDAARHRVRRVGPDGIITTVAGTGTWGYTGDDGGLADTSRLSSPGPLAVGPDGSVHVADVNNHRVRRIAPDGRIYRFAGNGVWGQVPVVDDVPATQASFKTVTGLAVGTDGSVYIADNGNHRIRRVSPDGIITTFAGTGVAGNGADGQPARQTQIAWPGGGTVGTGLALAPDGSLYFIQSAVYSFGARVRKVTPDGLIRTVGGRDGAVTPLVDGTLASQNSLYLPNGLALGSDGTVFVTLLGADTPPTHHVVRIRPDGLLYRVAGVGTRGTTGDGGAALQAQVNQVRAVAVGQDGSVIFADEAKVRRVAPSLPGLLVGSTVVASADGSELYVFSPAGRILLTLDALTGDTLYVFSYDANRRLVSIRDPSGRETIIERDSSGLVSAVIAAGGQQTDISQGGAELVMTGPDGYPTTFVLDSVGRVTAVVDQGGSRTEYAYDGMGSLLQTTVPTGGVDLVDKTVVNGTAQVAFTPPATGVFGMAAQTLPSDATELIATLPGGLRETTIQNPDGSITTQSGDGSLITISSTPHPLYGLQFPLKSATIVTPGGVTTAYRTAASVTVDSSGRVLTELDSTVVNGYAERRLYDRQTRMMTVTSPAGRVRKLALDSDGRVVRDSTAGTAVRVFAYDSLGRLTSRSHGDRQWVYEYDNLGRVTMLRDPAGGVRRYAYDAGDRVRVRVTGTGDSTLLTYDSSGAVSTLSTPVGAVHRFTYTLTGRLASYVPPDVGDGAMPLRLEYDPAGRVERVIRSSGDTLLYVYDAIGRAATLTAASGTYVFAYDSVTGRTSRVTGPDGVALDLTYDGPMIVRREWTGPVAGSVSTTYDNDRRPVGQEINGANGAAFTYDADGNVSAAGDLTLTRDALNGRVLSATVGQVTTSFVFDPQSTPVEIRTAFGDSVLFAATYTRDSGGRVVEVDESVLGVVSILGFQYDSAGRLSAVSRDGQPDATYEYDDAGNRTVVATAGGVTIGTYDAQDRLIQDGPVSFLYSRNGELQGKIVDGDTTTYTFAPQGGLVAVDFPTGDRVEYVVDPVGRRLGKRVNGAFARGWLYDGDLQIVAELDATGQVTSRFVYGGPGNAPEYMISGGRTYRLVTDYLGSVRLVVDVASGSVVQRLGYDPFGRIIENTNPGFQPFGFAGGLYDEQTGFVRFGRRDYDPATGRWTSKDPLMFAVSEDNLYSYTGGDPINRVDPRGLQSMTLTETNAALVCNGIAATALTYAAIQAMRVARSIDWGGALTEVSSATGEVSQSEHCRNQQMGDAFGCMSCPSDDPGTPSGAWVDNHVPPRSLQLPWEPFCIGPHCARCSSRQGGFLSRLVRWMRARSRTIDEVVQYMDDIGTRW